MTNPYRPREMGDPHTLRQGLLPWANPIEGEGEAGPRDIDPGRHNRRGSLLARLRELVFGRHRAAK